MKDEKPLALKTRNVGIKDFWAMKKKCTKCTLFLYPTLGGCTFAQTQKTNAMIKNIIRQLFDLAKRLFTQLCDNDIVRIVKAWVKRLLTEEIENEVGVREEALKEAMQTAQQAQQVVTSTQAATSKKEKSETSLVEQMQAVIHDKWNIRFNELENNVELQPKESAADDDFKLMTERSHNSLIMHVQSSLPQCYRSWVDGYLNSEAVPAYHPLQHYLDHLPRWDGRNRLTEVAHMVSHDVLWVKVFSRWMRAMVAGWQNTEENCHVFQNQIAPLLLSDRQGMGKSTFCRTLLPPVLRRYYTDKFDLTADSGAEKKLGRFALINMDEFDRYNERQMGILKNLMQMTDVKMRLPRGRSQVMVTRIASFIGTSNYTELLTDPTGSRRFFCQPVEFVMGEVTVDHDQLYAQLLAEIAKGKPLFFTKDEEREIELHNKAYYKFSAVNDVFSRFYMAPDATCNLKKDQTITWLSASELFDELKTQAPRSLQGITIKRITKEMRRLGVPRRHLCEGNVWGVKKR